MATISGGNGGQTFVTAGSNDANGQAMAVQTAINNALTAGTLTLSPSPTANPPAGAGLATISAPGTYVLAPANTSFLVNAAAGESATVSGAGGRNQNVLIGEANVTFFTNGGTGAVVTGDGNEFIGTPTTGGGQFSVTTGAGNDTVVAFTGNNTVSAGAGNNLIGLGAAGTNSSNLVFASGNDTISGLGGTGSDTIIAGSGSTYVTEGSKSLTFLGGSGSATIIGGTASSLVLLGAGGGEVGGGSNGGNLLYGGTGSAGSTLFGGGNGDVLFARGSGQTLLVAGAGNETLTGSASTGNNIFFTGSGNALVGGGQGNDLVVVGTSGSATIDGGAGADIVSFTNRGPGGSTANVLINGFDPAQGDRVQLSGFSQGEVAAVAGTPSSGGSTSVVLSDGTRVTFGGVASLNPSNFV